MTDEYYEEEDEFVLEPEDLEVVRPTDNQFYNFYVMSCTGRTIPHKDGGTQKVINANLVIADGEFEGYLHQHSWFMGTPEKPLNHVRECFTQFYKLTAGVSEDGRIRPNDCAGTEDNPVMVRAQLYNSQDQYGQKIRMKSWKEAEVD